MTHLKKIPFSFLTQNRSCNELSKELSINEVYSNAFPELKILIGHLNVNSLRNKYVSTEELLKRNI